MECIFCIHASFVFHYVIAIYVINTFAENHLIIFVSGFSSVEDVSRQSDFLYWAVSSWKFPSSDGLLGVVGLCGQTCEAYRAFPSNLIQKQDMQSK